MEENINLDKNCMGIFSSQLFDIIEIWCENTENLKTCTYIYATENMIKLYPKDVILNNNNNDKDHKLSNKLCELAKKSKSSCYMVNASDINSKISFSDHKNLPIKFVASFLLDNHKKLTGENISNYIVCFSMNECDLQNPRNVELINKIPSLYKTSSYLRSYDEDENSKLETCADSLDGTENASYYTSKYDFSFPIESLPVRNHLTNINVDQFTNTKHIASGANSNVFLAEYKGSLVVLKLMKEKCINNPIAQREFDLESCMLSRIQHDNIVNFVAASTYPVRFIAMEWLGGCTLQGILVSNKQKKGLMSLFQKKRKSLSFISVLLIARKLAEALDYLHDKFHEEATIIHRDLKPENIAFTIDDNVKLIDFGLSTCVKKRMSLNDVYQLTGNTGSLRYMAPEVALKLPYNEKVDVYSFGIILWQMAQDKTPFKGLTREEFMNEVVKKSVRPPIDKNWPVAFINLLTNSWDREPSKRPPFSDIITILDDIIKSYK